MGMQGRGSASCRLLRRGAWLILMLLRLGLLTHDHQEMCEATQYTVGDSSKRWNLNVDYSSWAAKYSFKTGDTLLFSYNAEAHSVYQVNQADYGSCNNLNPLKMYSDGNTIIDLNKATTYYFICGVSEHCALGMKMLIKIEEASTSTPQTSSSPQSSTVPPTALPKTSIAPIFPPTSSPPLKTPTLMPPINKPPLAKTPTSKSPWISTSPPSKAPSTLPPFHTPITPPSTSSPTPLISPTASPPPSFPPTLALGPSPLHSLSPSALFLSPTSAKILTIPPTSSLPSGSTSLQDVILLNIFIWALLIVFEMTRL